MERKHLSPRVLEHAKQERFRESRNRNQLTGELRPVPPHLKKEFRDRFQLLYVNDCLKAALQALQIFDLEGLTFDVDVPKTVRLIGEAIEEMNFGLPWKECDCPAFSNCEKCGGRRWLSLRQTNTLGLTCEDGSRSNVLPYSPRHIGSTFPEETFTRGELSIPSSREET